MPRDLGKAKRSDLTGHFPGEQAEYGSAFARYLEGAGQLKPLEDGTYLDTPSGNGNGNGRATEVPGRNGADGHGGSTDTEVGRGPPGGGNASDTAFDMQSDGFFDDDAMFPEPAFDNEPLPLQAAELEPVEFEPSADTLHPDGNEPIALDSVPDLTSPELDMADDEGEDSEDTEILDRESAPHVMPAPATSGDTGLLEPETMRQLPEDERISFAELAADDDETGSPQDIDEAEERITSKVEPRRDTDPRSTNPDAVVRDTVNFYNQTQNFRDQKVQSGFPTISPTVVNSTQPLPLNRDRHDTTPLRRETAGEPELVEHEPDLLAPQEFNPADAGFASSDEDTDTLRPEPVLEPLALDAEAELDEADRRETDKFQKEDREPPTLPLPVGTDKVDKQELARQRSGSELRPIADEKVAGGKDTQRFYVSDILAKKPKPAEHTGDTTVDLEPAEQGPPAGYGAGSDTAHELTGEATVNDRPDRETALPRPAEVNTDFKTRVVARADERIIPELGEEAQEDGDDTVDEEAAVAGEAAADVEKITDKLQPPVERDHTTRRRPVVQQATPRREPDSARSDRVKHITDALSQRLKQERQETLRLIEEAEAVAIRLRDASQASRTDLAAISERRASVGGNGATRAPEPEPAPDEFATAVFPSQPDQATAGATVPAAAGIPAAQRNPNRVPTRAIGEIVSELQRTANAPTSLSELLAQVSKNAQEVAGDSGPEDDDIDMLVAASGRLRETVESAFEQDRVSGRIPVVEDDVDYEASPRREPEPRVPAASSLSSDLDRLWKVLDSRRTATVVLPAADKARITRDDRADADVMEAWTQEMLWPTMAGIAVVTFALGALFVWVLSRM
ncbi:MAG: hypothetical protein K8I27_02475 [Planctomycetes bacterium]|nr:hypothetical protein [Planctomycetota bacterium]